jgi:UDP-3-O-[3-hydroxymyristoyl] N-acetylglucosamine deacetylase
MEKHQHTLKKQVSFRGIGLHSGKPVTLTVKPAEEDHGIRFKTAGQKSSMPAFMDRVVDTSLATTIAEKDMIFSTTEHLMAALAGLGIDNAIVELDGSEVPIMDGSAGPFVHIFNKANRKRQKSLRRILKITKPITYTQDDKSVTIEPYNGLKLTCEIDFKHKSIKKQKYTIEISPERFAKEIASARTFGFIDQVEQLKANGYALGGSLDNAVVIDSDGVINQDGLRFTDEFVRHKVLDLLGDLALLGSSVMGHVIAKRSGHSQHLGLLKEIAANPDCWQIIEYEEHGEVVLERHAKQVQENGVSLFPSWLQPVPLVNGRCLSPA